MTRLVVLLTIASALAGSLGLVNGGEPAVGKVESCSFPTQSLPPPFHVPTTFAEGYQVFRAVGE